MSTVSSIRASRKSARESSISRGKMSGTEKEDLQFVRSTYPPWPEWNDAELNAERWDVRPSARKGHKFRDDRRSDSLSSLERFDDPLGHIQLPPSLQPETWVRLHSIPLMEMYHESSTTEPILDLTTPNTHLLHSEVMRWIIAGIMNLHQLGQAHTVELEGQETAFKINSRTWKPWHHIYALCKVTQSGPHIPLVNPAGKYIVRLFYMGCWRRITVDDYIPLDSHKRPLLPMTASGIEMWPALLTKALLKVAALSWTPTKEILDFSVMACLTGWHAQELDLNAVPSRTIWWLCQKLLSAECDDPEDRFTGVKNVSVRDAYDTSSFSPRVSMSYHSMSSDVTDPVAEVMGSVVLCGVVQTPSPSIEHPVLITEAKVNSQGEDRPPTPLWKTFRWKKWALEQGLIIDTSEKNVKCVRMYSPLLKCQPDIEQAARVTSVIDMSILSDEDKLISKMSPNTLSQQERKSVPRRRMRSSFLQERDRRIEKKSNMVINQRASLTQKQPEEAKSSLNVIPENSSSRTSSNQEANRSMYPEFWIKFEKLVQCMRRFEIYYRTNSFVHNLNVTDISQISQKSNTPRKKNTGNNNDDENVGFNSFYGVSGRNNDYLRDNNMLYLLIDSMACKKLLFSISVLKPPVSLEEAYLRPNRRFPSSITSENSDERETYRTIPPTYYIQAEGYGWQSTQIQDITFAIKTVATTCHLIHLREGMMVFRLWMKLPEVYALRISSQTPFVLGNREMIQEILSGQSTSWKEYGSNFSEAFNKLVNIHNDSTSHDELLENLHKSYLPPKIPKPASKFAARLRRKIFSRFEKTLIELLIKQRGGNDDTIAQIVSYWRWLLQREKFGSRICNTSKAGAILEMHTSRVLDVTGTTTSPNGTSRTERTIKTVTNPSELASVSDYLRDSDDYFVNTYELPSVGERKKLLLSLDQEAGILFLRRMFSNEPEILRYYPFRNDDEYHIQFTDYRGMIPTFGQKWVPFLRFVVNVHANQNPYCAIYLNTTLPYEVIQVIDNDTLKEYPRFLGNIEPSYFPYNRRGYTIFAFAYEDPTKDHFWKLRLLTLTQQQLPHSCDWSSTKTCTPQEPPSLTIKEVKGHYMPNKKNVIFKCILTLKKTQILTLRTVMSNRNVDFLLIIRWEDGDAIKEYEGCGELTIPVLLLKGRDSGGPDFFRIEAQVLHKSWTFNTEEMLAIDDLTEKTLQEQVLFTIDQLRSKRKPAQSKRRHRTPQRDGKTKRSSSILNAPFWSLMLVVDKDLSSTVSLENDKRRAEEIRQMKLKWEKSDAGRNLRCWKIRQEFLTKDRYSPSFIGIIHEKEIEFEEKMKYLLEHYSCKESESKLERKNVERDRQEENRKRIEEFQEEYDEIKKQLSTIRMDQIRRNRWTQSHLEQFKIKSKKMKAEAYARRNKCVQLMKKK